MFVSSYNTYIAPSVSQSNKSSKSENAHFKLASKINNKTVLQEQPAQQKFPVDFISNYKVLNNQQKLQQQTQQFEQSKFSKVNVLNSAKVAYQEGATRFTFTPKVKVALAKTESKLPTPVNAKSNAVNIYLANDNYYKVTA